MKRTALTLALLFGMSACDDVQTPLDPAVDAASQDIPVLADHPATDPDIATVYVVHGINGSDLGLDEALPVDVSVDGACALTGFTFRTITDGIPLPFGIYDIQVYLADDSPCAGPVAIDAPGVRVRKGRSLSVVAHLDEAGAPTASVFDNRLRATRIDRRTRVIARHTAAFGPVDLLVNGGVAAGHLQNGQQTWLTAPAGTYVVALNAAGTDVEAFGATLDLSASTAFIAYAVGTPGSTFEVLLQALPLIPA